MLPVAATLLGLSLLGTSEQSPPRLQVVAWNRSGTAVLLERTRVEDHQVRELDYELIGGEPAIDLKVVISLLDGADDETIPLETCTDRLERLAEAVSSRDFEHVEVRPRSCAGRWNLVFSTKRIDNRSTTLPLKDGVPFASRRFHQEQNTLTVERFWDSSTQSAEHISYALLEGGGGVQVTWIRFAYSNTPASDARLVLILGWRRDDSGNEVAAAFLTRPNDDTQPWTQVGLSADFVP